jgi:hypothetical protein
MDVRSFFRCARIMSRTRDVAAANEGKDIVAILGAINTRTPAGCQILSAFTERTGLAITAARARSGRSRGTHYDFEVEVDGQWKHVEHKGSQVYRIPPPHEVPWKAGVQFYNGGCEKFSFARKYAQVWYTQYIASGTLREEFGLTSPTPSFEEWFEKDCRTQDNPMTAFGKELKTKVREQRGPRASLLEKRASVLEAFEVNDEDKSIFIAEVITIVKEVLSQKDYWLSVYGNLDSNFHAVWHPQFMIDDIHDVIVEKKKDLELTFVCSNDYKFHGILRWGKGAGFSCLRVDLK